MNSTNEQPRRNVIDIQNAIDEEITYLRMSSPSNTKAVDALLNVKRKLGI